LGFNYAIGGGLPFTQQVSVTSTINLSFLATTNTSWLTVNPTNGSTPTILNVSVNPNGLQPGIYTGAVTITPSGGPDPPQIIPVTLTITNISGLTVAPQSVSFSYQLGGTLPAAQTIAISGGSSIVGYSAFSNTSWLTVAPTNGVTPATVTVSVNPAGL